MPDSSDNVNSGARASGTVDWSRPIEAVHEDGRVVPVNLAPSEHGYGGFVPRVTKETPARDTNRNWHEDGSDYCHTGKWRIRNVQPTTPGLDPALWDRMVALVRDMADRQKMFPVMGTMLAEYSERACAILADLPKPVDPDVLLAREIAAATFERGDNARAAEEARNGAYDDQNGLVSAALDGIRKGRELAAPEVSHVG